MPSRRDPCDDCGSTKSAHLNGCASAPGVGGGGTVSKRNRKAPAAQSETDRAYEADKARQQQSVRGNIGKRYKVFPRPTEVPGDCRVVRHPQGGYTIVEGKHPSGL